VRVREDADRLPRRLVRSAGADRQRGVVDRDRAFMAGRPGRFQRNPTEISLVLKWDDLKVVPYSDDLKVVPYSDGRNLELKIRNLECNRFSRASAFQIPTSPLGLVLGSPPRDQDLLGVPVRVRRVDLEPPLRRVVAAVLGVRTGTLPVGVGHALQD